MTTPYYWPQVNPRRGDRPLPACLSGACQQGRKACPTPQACRLAEGDQVSFDDAPRSNLDWSVLIVGAAAIAVTLAWALWLALQIARIA